MDNGFTDIEKTLFRLPHRERARIARDLIRGLAKPESALAQEDWLSAWMDEVERRETEIDSGKAPLLSHEQVMDTLRWSLTK